MILDESDLNLIPIPALRCPAILMHRARFPFHRAMVLSAAIGTVGVGLHRTVLLPPVVGLCLVGLCLVEDRSQHYGTDLLQLSHPLSHALIRRFSFGGDKQNPVHPGSQVETVSNDH